MLTEITISNLAVIERQSLSFDSGFNVISGETGAGKSVILSALEFILGKKLSTDMIRPSAESLEVQALFDISKLPQGVLAELPEIAHGEELVVSRSLPREGRGKVLINGRLGTVSLLEEIVSKIVNVCGQHHQTRLLDPKYHIELLDGFCAHEELLSSFKLAYQAWSEKKRILTESRERSSNAIVRREELSEILAELEELPNLTADRRENLEAEVKRLSNSEKLINLGQRLSDLLSADGGVENGVAAKISEVGGAANEILRIDPSFEPLVERWSEVEGGVAEFERELARYISGLDLDSSSLEALREELSELARLERKYRVDCAGLLDLKNRSLAELSLYAVDSNLNTLLGELSKAEELMKTAAKKLTQSRVTHAKVLAAHVSKSLAELNMREALLDVRFTEAAPTLSGSDKVEFLITTNSGFEPKPLAQIASGGELSRIMLVLKKVLRERSGVNVLIFDEVDAGVSGSVARAVGRMLKDISDQSQVLCITHLPQVASLSDRHFLVNKESGKRAVSLVRQLSELEKVDEIARMLAGYTITEASRASARELIASKH